MENKIEVVWTGEYPCLCAGEWVFTINGKRYPVPFDGEAETEGDYSFWYFGGESGWDEQWRTSHDGLSERAWIAKYLPWLHSLPLSPEEYRKVYTAFQAEDWRHGSCGGCI